MGLAVVTVGGEGGFRPVRMVRAEVERVQFHAFIFQERAEAVVDLVQAGEIELAARHAGLVADDHQPPARRLQSAQSGTDAGQQGDHVRITGVAGVFDEDAVAVQEDGAVTAAGTRAPVLVGAS